jgi:5-methylcytosine-specific restriction endonuclease McrA
METVSLSIIHLRSNVESALASQQVFINLSPDFQRDYESWDDSLMTRFIESILLGRATNPIWTIHNPFDESEEVLDGKHRLTTALHYLTNHFCITGKYLMTLEKEKYDKKKFQDLPAADKVRVRNYQFMFNKLDETYKLDRNKLRDMYEILNRSSRVLNEYEFNKVLFRPLYDVFSAYKDDFVATGFFDHKRDRRGQIDTEMIAMFVLTQEMRRWTWASMSDMVDKWLHEQVGTTDNAVQQYIADHTANIQSKMDFLLKILRNFRQLGLFNSTDRSTFRNRYIIYKCFVARCAKHIESFAVFNRLADTLMARFQQEIIDALPSSGHNRNALFQKDIIARMDTLLTEETGNVARRLFPRRMIAEKLAEQQGICPKCGVEIREGVDEYEGDHVVAWTAGGATVPENLQVLHRRCHQLK